jgi:predicted amidophosphoribosyltransferase
MRGIARRHGHDHLCGRCSVTWRGAEQDCWSCGLPATSDHSRPGAALQLLLTLVGRPLAIPTAPRTTP